MTQREWAKDYTSWVVGNIKGERERQKLSAKQLADLCAQSGNAIGRDVIANLESGRRSALSLSDVLTFAAALKVPAVALLFPPDDAGATYPGLGGDTSVYEGLRDFSGWDDSKRSSADADPIWWLGLLRQIFETESAAVQVWQEMRRMTSATPDLKRGELQGQFEALISHSFGLRFAMRQTHAKSLPPVPAELRERYEALSKQIDSYTPSLSGDSLGDD